MASPLTLLRVLVAQAPAPLGLVELDQGLLLEASPFLREVTSASTQGSFGDLIAGIDARHQVTAALDAIRAGHLTAWTGPTPVSRRGRLLSAQLAMVGASRQPGKQRAAVVTLHVDAAPTVPIGGIGPVVMLTDRLLNIEGTTRGEGFCADGARAGLRTPSLLGHIHPDDVPGLARDCVHSLSGNVVVRGDTRVLSSSGAWDHVAVAIHPIGGGQVTCGPSAYAFVLRAPACVTSDGQRTAIPSARLHGPHPVDPLLRHLTPREHEIARRVADAQRVTGIATDLVVSPSTVRNHLSAIYRKIGVRSQSELVDALRAARDLRRG